MHPHGWRGQGGHGKSTAPGTVGPSRLFHLPKTSLNSAAKWSGDRPPRWGAGRGTRWGTCAPGRPLSASCAECTPVTGVHWLSTEAAWEQFKRSLPSFRPSRLSPGACSPACIPEAQTTPHPTAHHASLSLKEEKGGLPSKTIGGRCSRPREVSEAGTAAGTPRPRAPAARPASL